MNEESTILVVDDEPALRLGLAAKIKRQGYKVVTASNGVEGIQSARNFLPDLILSDVMMPPPNGFEMRRLMGKDPQLASIPFIFLTARNGVDDRINGIRDGADDYITKPFVTDELFARIEAVLRRVKTSKAHGREEMSKIVQHDMEKLKQEILRNFQHEMRTPLTNIIMPLELIINNKFDDPEEQAQFIRAALSNVDRLDSLVNDFILLTNIDQGNLNNVRQLIDVNNHILLPIQKRLERYKSKNITFIPQVELKGDITAPRREFTRALVHLVDNAFKFGPDNGQVKLAVKSTEDGSATITVQDYGAGIPHEFREKVFERHYQINRGDSRKYDGLGVGLTIASAIFTNIGGTVSIVDEGVGCIIQATIPAITPEDIFYG